MPVKCWKIDTDPLKNQVKIRYWGYTPTDALAASIDELRAALPKTPSVLVIDVRELEGHNPEGRPLWKVFLEQHRSVLSTVYVVSPLPMAATRMVALVIGLAVGVRLRLVDSLKDIP
ncbi:MAG TPA: hypothetical protein VFS43_03800 [Polyangiaceae bacterium]|nr:hypothetical protein [Polyangiaceae bacterium]